MWKLIKITQRPHLIKCIFDADNKVTFVLYDHKESWCDTLTIDEVKRKAKLLNRRYDFREENVRDTLAGGDLELATLDQMDGGKLMLKLKYRVKNCPFHFEWTLKKQTLLEFQTTFVRPLCSALMGCNEQIEILTETLKKKDAEILQYRKEGAILSRKTLATKLFDFDEFAKKYEDSNTIAVDFSEMGKFLQSMEAKKEIKTATNEQVKKQESTETKESSLKNPIPSASSPGQRKRKIQELKQKHLERNLKTRKQIISYESSQSQETSTTSSQSTEVHFEIKTTAVKAETNSAQQKLEDNVKSKIDQIKNRDLNVSNTNDEKNAPEMSTTRKSPCTSPQKVKQTNTSPQKNKIAKAATNSPSKITESTCVPQQMPVKSSPSKEAENLEDSIEIKSDSEDSHDIILTPSKLKQLRRARGRPPSVAKSDTESETCDFKKARKNLNKSLNEEHEKEKEKEKDSLKSQSPLKQKAIKSLAISAIVEISTDSDDSETIKHKANRYPQRKNTPTTPTKNNCRVTRSSPQSTAVVECPHVPKIKDSIETTTTATTNFKIFDSPSKSKAAESETEPVILGEISSQLDAIRKELQSLEALRLADLKERTC